VDGFIATARCAPGRFKWHLGTLYTCPPNDTDFAFWLISCIFRKTYLGRVNGPFQCKQLHTIAHKPGPKKGFYITDILGRYIIVLLKASPELTCSE
jgi:hypothetical protein